MTRFRFDGFADSIRISAPLVRAPRVNYGPCLTRGLGGGNSARVVFPAGEARFVGRVWEYEELEGYAD